MTLKEYDTVRIISLQEQDRPYDGTEGVMRAPKIGDRGVIVHIYDGIKTDMSYVVESVDPDGYTIWLADFREDELDTIADNDKTEDHLTPSGPGFVVYLVGIILGAGIAITVATFWLSVSSIWVALAAGATAALYGVFSIENIGEAIIMTLTLCFIMFVLIMIVPGLTTIKAGVVPLACGLIAGKFVVGIWKEVRA